MSDTALFGSCQRIREEPLDRKADMVQHDGDVRFVPR